MREKITTYKKLMRIEFSSKTFDIYSDRNYKKAFLEVKVKNGNEKSYYPNLEDYLKLSMIYNRPRNGILYSKKYNFTEKIAVLGMYGIASLTLLTIFKEADIFYKLQKTSINNHNIYQDGVEVDIYNIDELSNFGYEKVSFETLRHTLLENQSLDFKYKTIIMTFINKLEEKLPEVDLRVLNINLKKLCIENDLNSTVVEGQKLKKIAYYDIYENKIHVSKNGYSSEDNEIRTLFHELVHVMRYTQKIQKLPESLFNRVILSVTFEDAKSRYGDNADEAITEILADYLLKDDYQNYFSNNDKNFASYENITSFYYQTLCLLKEEYTFYDFLEKGVFYLEDILKKYDLEESIDILGVYQDSLEANEVDSINLESVLEIEEKLLRERIKQEISLGKSNFQISCMAKEMKTESNLDKFQVVDELLRNRYDDDFKMSRIKNNAVILLESDEKKQYLEGLNLYSNDGKLILIGDLQSLEMVLTSKNNQKGYHLVSKTMENLNDLLSGEGIDEEIIIDKIPLSSLFLESMVSVTEDFLNSEEFHQWVDKSIMTKRYTEQRIKDIKEKMILGEILKNKNFEPEEKISSQIKR